MKNKRLLALTDLDDLSSRVTQFTVHLAKQMKASEIILLNIIIPAYPQSFTTTGDVFVGNDYMVNHYNLKLMETQKEVLQDEAMKYSTDQITIRPLVRFNGSKTDLNHIINELEAGLIISGSQDENGFLDKLFGSETEKLVRKIDSPSIILKENCKINDINTIGVAIDIEEEDQSGLKDIFEFAKILNARINLFHVITDAEVPPEKAEGVLGKLAKQYQLSQHDVSVIHQKSLDTGLKEFTDKNNPDMLAVLSQGKGKITKLIYGSSTEEIIHDTEKPVFVSKTTSP